MKTNRFYKAAGAVVLLTAGVAISGFKFNKTPLPAAEKGLKDYYASYFPIGVAVSPQMLTGTQAELIKKEFNSVTPENAMKMGVIHPSEKRYNWRDADSIVNFAVRNGLRVRGHNLCWHEQAPSWFFTDSTGKQITKEVLFSRMREHIYTVVKRYKGKIYAWDVVNEAVDDDSSRVLRNSMWYKIAGDEFIAKAFQYAHEADPDAKLFYNDYNTERPEKSRRMYQLIKGLVDKKVPIDGVGLQAHWSIYEPTRQELTSTIQQYVKLGLDVQFTELDMSVYPWEKERRAKRPGETDQLTPELEQKQIDQYKMVFDVFRKFRKNVTGVTFWNLADRYTWLDSYPVAGRKNYPLLFDTNFGRKKAYTAVTEFKK